MAAYEGFAQVYDSFMDNVPYDEWTEYIKEIFKKYSLPENTGVIADIGCGTGNMTIPLAKAGYEMIGVDLSEEMLAIANEKSEKENLNILYINQDMRELELLDTVDGIISLCDSLNYITEKEELIEVFKRVYKYLEKKGLFVFDLNTIYKFENILSDNSFCQTTENSAYTWENYYDSQERINEFYTNFFVENSAGLYERYEEFHYEKGYTIDEITEMLEKAGLEFLAVYNELTFDRPTEKSEKIFFVARKN